MRIIKASANIESYTPDLEKVIEAAGRTCYKSEDKITRGSASAFIEKIKNFKHESVLEHGSITVRFIVDRGVSHELVRHRLASFSQESTRYCNYGKDKFGNEITVIDIRGGFPMMSDKLYKDWANACAGAELNYLNLLAEGATAQLARGVLPNSVKTEAVMTANPREWRYVLTVRGHRHAHPQMREVMAPLAEEFARRWPSLFAEVADAVS